MISFTGTGYFATFSNVQERDIYALKLSLNFSRLTKFQDNGTCIPNNSRNSKYLVNVINQMHFQNCQNLEVKITMTWHPQFFRSFQLLRSGASPSLLQHKFKQGLTKLQDKQKLPGSASRE